MYPFRNTHIFNKQSLVSLTDLNVMCEKVNKEKKKKKSQTIFCSSLFLLFFLLCKKSVCFAYGYQLKAVSIGTEASGTCKSLPLPLQFKGPQAFLPRLNKHMDGHLINKEKCSLLPSLTSGHEHQEGSSECSCHWQDTSPSWRTGKS